MATKEELQEAVAMLVENEKSLITEIEQLLTQFGEQMNQILADTPTNPAPMTPASQLFIRIKNSVPVSFMSELNNLKQQYGMVSQTAPVMTPTT